MLMKDDKAREWGFEVRIFNVALEEDEIAAHATAGPDAPAP